MPLETSGQSLWILRSNRERNSGCSSGQVRLSELPSPPYEVEAVDSASEAGVRIEVGAGPSRDGSPVPAGCCQVGRQQERHQELVLMELVKREGPVLVVSRMVTGYMVGGTSSNLEINPGHQR